MEDYVGMAYGLYRYLFYSLINRQSKPTYSCGCSIILTSIILIYFNSRFNLCIIQTSENVKTAVWWGYILKVLKETCIGSVFSLM